MSEDVMVLVAGLPLVYWRWWKSNSPYPASRFITKV